MLCAYSGFLYYSSAMAMRKVKLVMVFMLKLYDSLVRLTIRRIIFCYALLSSRGNESIVMSFSAFLNCALNKQTVKVTAMTSATGSAI